MGTSTHAIGDVADGAWDTKHAIGDVADGAWDASAFAFFANCLLSSLQWSF